MSIPFPKFAYNAGSGIVDFSPTWPPTKKPGFDSLDATRHDSITSAGEKQSVFERIDQRLALNFTSIPSSDLTAWNAFLMFALSGANFTYFPDNTIETTFFEYTLEDEKVVPAWIAPGWYSLKINMLLYVGPGAVYSS
jgi:hypothetical protein